MAKKKPSRSRSSTRFLVFAIFGIMVVMGICAVWNGSAFDLLWMIVTFFVGAVVTVIVIAPLLLPIENDGDERGELRRVFNRFLMGTPQPMAVVREGKVVFQTKDHDPDDYLPRGIIVTDSSTVVALRTSTGLSRVEGANIDNEGYPHSGVIFTNYEEEIDAVIKQILSQRAEFKPVEKAAETGDYVKCSYEGKVGEELIAEVEDLASYTIQYDP